MKRFWKIAPLLVFITLSFSGCFIDFDDDNFGNCERGRGQVITETLFIDPFDGFDLQIPAKVYLTQGPNFEVTVEGYANLIDELDLRVRNGFWEIEFDRCVNNLDEFNIFITIPDIRELKVSGSGDIFGENVFFVDDINLDITGSGNMDLALEADDIDARITGSGEMKLEGVCDDLDVRISGSGDLHAFALDAEDVDVDITGSGDAEVFAEISLTVRISGSGDVFYKGQPSIESDIFGSGRIRDAN